MLDQVGYTPNPEGVKKCGAIISVNLASDGPKQSEVIGILNKYSADQVEVVDTASYV